jgi:hypothetical protein
LNTLNPYRTIEYTSDFQPEHIQYHYTRTKDVELETILERILPAEEQDVSTADISDDENEAIIQHEEHVK